MSLNLRLQRRKLPEENAGLNGIHPLLARLYAARGITRPDELSYTLDKLADIRQLKGIGQAVDRLARALRDDEAILIVGDFDADGATSTALAMRGLRAMGFRRLAYLVPNRFDFGYGLTPALVDVAAEQPPGLIITVDNGISSIAGVRRARAHGIDVLVTDHHLPGEVLPDAIAIVNPNQPGDEFPDKHLAGVGVMFCLLAALRQHLRASDRFAETGTREPNLARFLDLVALGTVADVVPLTFNNRILVEQGLRRIRSGKASPGILALLRHAGRNPEKVVAADMGFAVGPRLNAAGRLEDMSLGIECLLTDDPHQAERYATELNALNQERREIEAQMQAQALAHLDALDLDEAGLPWGICLFQEDWHQGVVGLVASRVKEKTHRPVIAFAGSDEQTLKGSARSIPGLHIRDALARVNARNPGLIDRFGGHAMAAGLSLGRGKLNLFSAAFDTAVKAALLPEQLQPVIYTDGMLEPAEFTLETAHLLRNCGPWGQAFPEPLFDGEFRIIRRQVLKEKHLKLQLGLNGSRQVIEAIAFNVDVAGWPAKGERVHIAYTLNVNDFRGESLQLMVRERVMPEA